MVALRRRALVRLPLPLLLLLPDKDDLSPGRAKKKCSIEGFPISAKRQANRDLD